jgi:ribosomal-protein-serine acetyltransferase
MASDKINPILLDIPSEFSSARLLMRIPRAGDSAIIWPVVKQSMGELMPWLPWANDEFTESAEEEWCRKTAAEFLKRERMGYLIFSKECGEYFGGIGACDFKWDVPSCEIGYWLRSDRTGRGYATEAVGALCAMLRERIKVRRIQIRADELNARSRRVAELAGFQSEGIMRCDCAAGGGRLRNTCLYSRIYDAGDQELSHG